MTDEVQTPSNLTSAVAISGIVVGATLVVARKKATRRAGSLVQRELDFAEGKRLRDCNPVQFKIGQII